MKKLFLLAAFMMLPSIGWTYTVVQASTAAPAGTEAQFIAATTAQFNASVLTNPFFAGTYQMTIFGKNQNYNPPLTDAQLLNSIVYLSTSNYVYGYANGMEYQNKVNEGLAVGFGVNCSTPSAFNLIYSSTATFNAKTCLDVVNSILSAFYSVNLSTPPVLP